MTKTMKPLIAVLCCALALPAIAQSSAKPTNDVEREFGSDRFAADKLIVVVRPVAGDLVAAGSEMEVAVPVAGDALLAGGSVVVSKAIGQSLYAAAGKLLINDSIARNVGSQAGGLSSARFRKSGGNVTVAGGEVELKGKVKGYVQAAGGRVFIDAIIAGNVEATLGRVDLGPNANITGNFRYSSREPLKRDPAALTNGGVEIFEAPGG